MTTTTAPHDPHDPAARIRFRCPDRAAVVDPRILDTILAPDHPARVLWQRVCELDLADLVAAYRARHHRPGRPPIDPRILITLWLHATTEGIRGARRLAEACTRDDVYRWICGGVPVNYHTLADFRVRHAAWLQRQVNAAVAALHAAGSVPLHDVGQDGLRIRAWAGSDSFKSLPTLKAEHAQAQTRLAELEAADRQATLARGNSCRTRKEAAQLRGARDRCARLEQTLHAYGPVAEARESRKKGDGIKTRLSVTDPECRKMKMADGGFRPAYNAQFATDLGSLVPVAATLTDAGNDAGQAVPLQATVEAAYGQRPHAWYVDGGYATHADIEALTDAGITVYTPIKAAARQRARGEDPAARKAGESDAVAAWRARMCAAAGQEAYKQRGLTELPHAVFRNWGLYQVTVRGLRKANAVVLWYLWALVLQRGRRLERPQPQEAGDALPAAQAAASGAVAGACAAGWSAAHANSS